MEVIRANTSRLILFLPFVIALLFAAGCGGSGDSGSNWAVSPDKITLTGKVSGGLASLDAPALAGAPANGGAEPARHAGALPKIYLRNVEKATIIDSTQPGADGAFTFAGDFRGLLLSVFIGQASREVLVGRVDPGLRLGSVISVSFPYDSTGGFDESAIIATNMIRTYGLTAEVLLTSTGTPGLWNVINQAKLSLAEYIRTNPSKKASDVMRDTTDPASPATLEMARLMNITAPSAGSLSGFDITLPAGTIKAGEPFELRIRARSASGAAATAFDSIAAISVNTGQGTFTPADTPRFANGECVVGQMVITRASQAARISVSASGMAGHSPEFKVLPGATSVYGVTVGTAQDVGTGFYASIKAIDRFGNAVNTDNSTIIRVAPNSGTESVSFFADPAYFQAISQPYNYPLAAGEAKIYMKASVPMSYTFDASDAAGIRVTSPPIRVGAMPVSRYELKVSLNQIAGVGFSAMITALDKDGAVVTTESFTEFVVTMTASTDSVSFYSDPSYTMEIPYPARYVMNSGVATIYMRSRRDQGIVIVATGGADKVLTSGLITVSPVPITSYAIEIDDGQTAGVEFAGRIVARDSAGNVISTDSSVQLMVSASASGGVEFYSDNAYTTTLSQPASYVLTKGKAEFFVRVTKAQTLSFSASDIYGRGVASGQVTVVPGPVSSYSLSVTGAVTTDGIAGRITALDQYGNQASNSGDIDVTLELASGSSAVDFFGDGSFSVPLAQPAGYTLRSGTADFFARPLSLGAISIAATDGSGRFGISGPLEVTYGAFDHFAISSDGPQPAGSPISLTVTAEDSSGNTIENFSSSGSLSISGTTGSITWSGNGVANETGGGGVYNGAKSFVGGRSLITVANSKADQQKTITVTDSVSGKAFSVVVSWISGAFHHFDISTIASPRTAGDTIPVVIKAMDVNGNVDYSFNASASLADATRTISPSVAGPFVSGVWTGEIVITRATDNDSVTVSAASIVSSSNAFAIRHSAIDRYQIDPPATRTAGVGFSGAITARDRFGNVAVTDSATLLTVGSTSSNVSFFTASDLETAGSSYKLSSGTARYHARNNRAESIAITVSDVQGRYGTSSVIVINPGMIATYEISNIPAQIAGGSLTGSITARDSFGNVAVTDNSTILTMNSTGSGVTFYTGSNYIAPTSTYRLASGVAQYYARNIRAEAFTIGLSDGSGKNGVSGPIAVTHAQKDHYTIDVVASQTAGAGFSNKISARDRFGNLVTSDSTTEVNVATSGAGLAFFTSNTFVTPATKYLLVAGQADYHARDTLAETVNISAFDAAGYRGTSSDITISPAPVGNYVVTVTGSMARTAGVGFSGVITAKDAYNNTAATMSGVPVNMSTNGTGVTFYTDATYSTATSTYLLAAGTVKYYAVNTRAENFTITATDAQFKTGSTSFITITPAALASYDISAGTPRQAGNNYSGTITGKDAFGNTVDQDSATVVTMTTTATGLTFYSDSSYVNPVVNYTLSSGVTSYYVKNTKAETYKITATDSNGKTGTSVSIVNQPASTVSYVVSSTSPQASNVGFSNFITAMDSFGNVVTTDNSTLVSASSTGTGVFFYADASYSAFATQYTLTAGVARYYVKNTKTESFTISVSDIHGKSGTSAPITMLPGVTSKYSVNASTPQAAGAGFIATITAQDQYNNKIDYDSTTSVSVTSNGTMVTFYTDATYGTPTTSYQLSNGVATCYVKNLKAEIFKITATDGAGYTGTSGDITVNHGPIANYTVNSVASIQAGTIFARQIVGLDAYGNQALNDNSTIVTVSATGTGSTFYVDIAGTATTNTYTLSGGVAVYNLKKTKAEAFTVGVSDANGKNGTSAIINADPGPVSNFVFAAVSDQVAGVNFTGTLTGYDAFSNPVNDNTTFVTMNSSTGHVSYFTDGTYATPTGGYVLSSGSATFYARDTSAESLNLVASNGVLGIFSNSAVFTVNPAPIASYVVDVQVTPVTAGVGFFNVITAKDAFNNTVTTDNATVVNVGTAGGTGVTFYTNGTYLVPAVSYTLSNGAAIYFARDTVAETFKITVADANGKVGLSNNLTAGPGPIASYVVMPQVPQTLPANVGFNYTITAKDANGNTVTGDSTTVVNVTALNATAAAFYTDATYTVPAPLNNYTLTNGVVSYYLNDNPAVDEVIQVKVSDSNSKTGVSDNITIDVP